jgi:hypothetical protein
LKQLTYHFSLTKRQKGSSMTTLSAPFPDQTSFSGKVNFSLPNHRLDSNPKDYLTFREGITRPVEPKWIPLYSLRDELERDKDEQNSIFDQMALRGFAAVTFPSAYLTDMPIKTDPLEEFALFVEETRVFLLKELQASHVIVWNTQYRNTDPRNGEKKVKLQLTPETETNALSQEHAQPPASFAHIDQTDMQGRLTCNRALAGQDSTREKRQDQQDEIVEDFVGKKSRVMIVNVWRPIRGEYMNGKQITAPLTDSFRYLKQPSRVLLWLSLIHVPSQRMPLLSTLLSMALAIESLKKVSPTLHTPHV